MKKIGVFYGSSTGNTQEIAEKIQEKWGEDNVDIYEIAEATKDQIEEYDNLIFGTSTWGDGELQDDFDCFIPEFEEIDFSGKTIALYGFGDQESYPDTFCNGMGWIYEVLMEKGAKIIGQVSSEGYEFDESKSITEEGDFCGLALDEDNQSELTEERLENWLKQIKPKFKK